MSKLGRVLFHNNSYIRSTLFFTKSSALLKMVKKLIFLKELGTLMNTILF